MLEFAVHEKFEEDAQKLLGEGVQGISERTFPSIIAGIMDGLRGGNIAEKLTAYAVNFNKDGTTEVKRSNVDLRNEYEIQTYLNLDGGRTLMVSNEKGDTLCIAPFELNGASYLKTFKVEDAQAFRDSLAEVKEPKKPSAYDRFCNWCAETFLNRPGKAVQAYNEQKAYYDSMQKLADTIGSIPEKVEEYKQGAEEQQLLEEERQKELEQQRELERQRELETQRLQEEARLKAEEDARRKAQEEERQRLEELEKKRMESERKEKEALDKVIEAENLKRAMDVELKLDQVRLQKVEELQKTLPKMEKELNTLVNQRKNLKEQITVDEKNLNLVKASLEKEKRLLEQSQKDLKESKQTLKDLDKDLKELDRLKDLYAQKEVQTKNLKDAREAIVDLKQQIKDAEVEFKKTADEYHKVAGAGHIFVMKPEEYLQYIYNQAKAGREQIHQQERAGLATQMKEIEDQIEVRNASKQKIKDEAKVWDYLPGIRGFRQKAQFMDKEDALKADLEKQYKELQKQDQQLQKDFDEREAEHKTLALDFSPENLKRTEDYLKAGLADAKDKYEAFQNAEKRETKLKNLLSDQEHARSKALREIEYLDSHIQGKPYDAKLHERTQDVYNRLDKQVKEMPRQILNIQRDVNEKSKLVKDADFTLNQNKENLEKMDKRYITLGSEIDHGKSQLQNFTKVLQEHGVLPPQNQMQGQQPQIQPPAPKPPVMGGPGGI